MVKVTEQHVAKAKRSNLVTRAGVVLIRRTMSAFLIKTLLKPSQTPHHPNQRQGNPTLAASLMVNAVKTPDSRVKHARQGQRVIGRTRRRGNGLRALESISPKLDLRMVLLTQKMH